MKHQNHRPCRLALVLTGHLLAAAACQDAGPAIEQRATPLQLRGATVFRSAVLNNAAGDVVGRVAFARVRGPRVTVVATVDFPGIRPGFHGIHLHANDNPANGAGCVADPAAPPNTHFVSADGHYNPTTNTHGAHGGDLPNIVVLDDGTGFLSLLDEIDLDDIDGRAVILHEGVDNHGHVPVGTAANQYTANGPEAITLTQATGNAGNRIACGLVQ